MMASVLLCQLHRISYSARHTPQKKKNRDPLFQRNLPSTHPTSVSTGLHAAGHRLPDDRAKLGIRLTVGRKGFSILPLHYENDGCSLPARLKFDQLLQMAATPASDCVRELAYTLPHQGHRLGLHLTPPTLAFQKEV